MDYCDEFNLCYTLYGNQQGGTKKMLLMLQVAYLG